MKRGVFIFWAALASIASLRLAFSFAENGPGALLCLKQKISGSGTVMQEPERKEGGQAFVVHADEISSGGAMCATSINIRMKVELYPRFAFGDRIYFQGKISQPLNFKSESGRTFDYKGFLAKDGIYYEIKSATARKDGGEVFGGTDHDEAFSFGFGDKISSALFRAKRGFVGNLERALGEPHAALAAGLVVGEKSALGKSLLEDFRVVGLIHIIVLSGFNITIVGDAMRRMLSFLPRIWGIGVGGVGIILFGIMVGGGATVVRSCFMASIALSADIIRRDYSATRALIFAGLLMVIQNPLIVFHDPSFQLSFMATLGLIVLASPIEGRLGFITERFGVRGIVASTIATQIFVSPYILYMMGQISIIGMAVNILVLPIVPLTMLAVFLTGAAGFIWMPISQFFGWISHLLLSYELFMVEHFARVPYASLNVPIFSGWWVVVFYVVFFAIYFVATHRRQRSSIDITRP